MKWNDLKGLEAKYLIGTTISIPILLFAITYCINLGGYSSDFDSLGKLIIVMTLALFGVYGTIIFYSGLTLKQIGLTSKNVILGIIYSAILYIIFHTILFLLAPEKVQSNEESEMTLTFPSLPFNLIGYGIFLSVVWEEFVYRAFLLPQFQILFRKKGYRKSVILSIIITQVIFALHHLGNRIFLQQMDFQSILLDQISLILIGTILCVIYILTENLTYTIVVHLFMDFPILFLTGIAIPTQFLTFMYFLVALIGALIIKEFSHQHPEPIF